MQLSLKYNYTACPCNQHSDDDKQRTHIPLLCQNYAKPAFDDETAAPVQVFLAAHDRLGATLGNAGHPCALGNPVDGLLVDEAGQGFGACAGAYDVVFRWHFQ